MGGRDQIIIRTKYGNENVERRTQEPTYKGIFTDGENFVNFINSFLVSLSVVITENHF